jgi:NADPH:quinone reductase-like Zn-dependent oxidoreductase
MDIMDKTYRATVLTGKGGPEVLEVQELPLPEPGPGQVRVRVRASGVGSTDILMRRGSYMYAPKIPFTPGYEVVGDVEALGAGVQTLHSGQRVVALIVHGGYGEVVVRRAEEFVPVPDGLDDAEVVALILNYITAFQMIERVAKPRSGQLALVTGANGGVGTALLELLRLRGVSVIGAASPSEHELIRSYGATPIPARGTPVDMSVRSVAPEGVDIAFDVVGGRGTMECIRATKRGGIIVGYGFVGTMKNGKQSTSLVLLTLWSALVGTHLAGRRGAFYGVTALYRKDPQPFHEDLSKLFDLLERGQIKPKIAARLPLLEARRGNEMLEAGGLKGKIVLLAPELL